MGFSVLQPVDHDALRAANLTCFAAKWIFRKLESLFRFGLSVALHHTKSIMATNANAALIMRTFNECVSPINDPPSR